MVLVKNFITNGNLQITHTMSNTKEHNHDKIELGQKYGSIICEIAYNYAKDEAFSHLIFDDEDDIVLHSNNGMDCYHEDFQPIFDRHYDFVFSIFEKHYGTN